MSHQDNSVFVDASGRRRRAMRWAAMGVGVGCVGFLGVVIAGFFGSGPDGGTLPWVEKQRPAAPALIGSDPSSVAEDEDDEDDESARPSPGASRSSAAPSPSPTPTPTKAASTATARPTSTSGSDSGGTAGTSGDVTDRPGQGRGATKRPK